MPPKITIPGFLFSGIHCGIKDDAKKKDLSLIYSEEPATLVSGVFTQNKVCAAPVFVCRDVVKKGKARLVVINSGIANACTGKRGMRNALAVQREAARLFGLKPALVLVSSTGKIGDFLPLKKLLGGLEKSKKVLSQNGFGDAVKGIMTTDQFPKFGVVKGELGGKKYTIAVLAKGAGMLRPDMATMLAYVATDLCFNPGALQTLFRNAVEKTLNRITVDGDTSTNDTAIIMANGRAGNKPFKPESPDGKKILKELTSLLEIMARKIALDGEGATKCCRVKVQGAANDGDAKKIAYAIGNSPLVKTALFGCDPNWGRIMAAIGYSGAKIREEKIGVKLGPYWLVKRGTGARFDASLASKYLKKENIEMLVACGMGQGEYHVYMSDLTYDYIHLNAEYHT